MDDTREMKELLGKRITGMEIDTSQQDYLRFHIDGEEAVIYEAYGDCCSQSWFYSVSDPQVLLGEVVREIEDVAMPDETEQDGEYIKYYGIALRTDKGICRIEYRNSSNGYYGGSLQQVGLAPDHAGMRFIIGDYIAGSDDNVVL
jgi:hypothetical protein